MPPNHDTTSGTWDRLASRMGPWPYSLAVGLLVLALAALAAQPGLRAESGIGAAVVALAADPFGTAPNPLAPRFLTPLLGWCLGLRGERVLILIAACCVLLPTVAARWALARGMGARSAALVAGALGLTLLTRTSLHYAGVPDVVTYLLVFGIWVWRARPWVASACFALALMNHERALFLLPWVMWLLWRESGASAAGRRAILVGLTAAIVLWGLTRFAILSHREVEHTVGYYWQPMLEDPLVHVRAAWPRQPLGFLSAFQWLWLPVVWCAWRLVRDGRHAELLGLGLPLFCAWLQMFFAYDSSRLAALAFPCLLPALEMGLSSTGGGWRRWLPAVLVLQIFTPQVFTAAYIVEVMPRWLLPW